MTIRTIIIVRWAAIGFAAGFVVFVFLITTERPLPSCAALIPQGVGIVTLGAVGGFGLGFCRSRSVPANAADDAGVSQLYTLSLALALLIFSCIAAIFMSLGAAKEAGPGRLRIRTESSHNEDFCGLPRRQGGPSRKVSLLGHESGLRQPVENIGFQTAGRRHHFWTPLL